MRFVAPTRLLVLGLLGTATYVGALLVIAPTLYRQGLDAARMTLARAPDAQ